ncbi:MAG: general secretion pathway protein GspL [Ideonella sp. MAG2]|nr:MAG: general secretion pathway protein GspL [Ideonella sp. MAG2]
MSTLIVLLPEQPRLQASQVDAPAPRADQTLHFVLTADGQQVLQRGSAAVADWPKADAVVAVVPIGDVAWHRLSAPKAPAGKLRAAVISMLEEAVLDDDADLHVALSPQFKAGEPSWVALLNKPWLKGQLEAIEATGLSVDRVVPAWTPEGPTAAHVWRRDADAGQPGQAWLAWRDADGALHLPLASEAVRLLLARQPADQAVAWTASPDGAEEAARWAGDALATLSADQQLLAAARSDWNLRQFDLTARHRGSRMATEGWRVFWHGESWRWVRWGLIGLVAVQLLGGRLWAWQQEKTLAQKSAARTQIVQKTFPHIRAVREPLAQMQREVEQMRSAAGRPSDADLEPLLQAADTAWPPSRGAADNLMFEPGKLVIVSAGWTPQEVDGFRERLRPLGYQVDDTQGRLTLVPAKFKPKPTASTPLAAPNAGPRPQALQPAPAAAPLQPARPQPAQPQPGSPPAGLGPAPGAASPPPPSEPQPLQPQQQVPYGSGVPKATL